MTDTTAVYVDGYNFYYGRIRGTSYKWVDIVTLFERLVHEQTPTSQMTLVRYFSAFALPGSRLMAMRPRSPKTAFYVGTKSVMAAVSRRQWEPTRMIAAGPRCRDMSMDSPSIGPIG